MPYLCEILFLLPSDFPHAPGSMVSARLRYPAIPKLSDNLFLGLYSDLPDRCGIVLSEVEETEMERVGDNRLNVQVQGRELYALELTEAQDPVAKLDCVKFER